MSSANYHTLVVGVGSPHGDDQLGWLAADALEAALQTLRAAALSSPPDERAPDERALEERALEANGWRVRRAATPSDLFDWLPGPRRLILIDACVDSEGAAERARSDEPGGIYETAAGDVRRLAPDSLARTTLRSSTGHLIGLLDVLELVRALGRSPERTEIWTAAGRTFSAGAAPDERTRRAAAEIARRLTAEAIEQGGAGDEAGAGAERSDGLEARAIGRA